MDQIAIIDRIAAGLGVKLEARRKWKQRGRVAHRWRIPIVEEAARQRLNLDAKAFDQFSARQS